MKIILSITKTEQVGMSGKADQPSNHSELAQMLRREDKRSFKKAKKSKKTARHNPLQSYDDCPKDIDEFVKLVDADVFGKTVNVPGTDRIYSCSTCGLHTRSGKDFDEHRRVCSRENPIQIWDYCNKCCMVFYNKQELIAHKTECLGKR
jgi:hypothetical protein